MRQIRPALPDSHPIERKGSYVIPTPAIYDLSESIDLWLENGCTGAVIFGAQRMGKSSAIKYIAQELKERLQDRAAVLSFAAIRHLRPSESAFFSFFLQKTGHARPVAGNIAQKRIRLSEFLIEIGMNTGNKQIILMIDEAQRMHHVYFDWLVEIQNDLNDAGIFASTFLIGQPELEAHRDALEMEKQMQIRGGPQKPDSVLSYRARH